MARVNVAAQTLPGAYPTLPVGAGTRDVSFQAYDAGLMNETPIVDGKTVVLVKNDHATDPKTVTFISVADSTFKRTGDITTYSLAAGDVAVFGPFKTAGWALVGKLQIDASSADIKLAVITLP
jgi:hypothetical protein